MSSEARQVEPVAAMSAPAEVSSLRYELATISVLWSRDLRRFFRQRSRIAGALIQPLIFWFVIGSGLSGTFRLQGAEGLGYMEYFFPGIVVMVVLFSSIFTTMSVIEDRAEGFLQAVLAAPASRGALVLGKALGGTSISMVQVVLFLALCPLAGFKLGVVAWPYLIWMLFVTSMGLTGIGFFIAWWLKTTQGYHAVMSVLLLPAWIVSGAMFPLPENTGWLGLLMRFNPMSYSVDGLRHGLYGLDAAIPGATLGLSPMMELALATAFAALALAASVWICNRSE